jgi:hypothetical protein
MDRLAELREEEAAAGEQAAVEPAPAAGKPKLDFMQQAMAQAGGAAAGAGAAAGGADGFMARAMAAKEAPPPAARGGSAITRRSRWSTRYDSSVSLSACSGEQHVMTDPPRG